MKRGFTLVELLVVVAIIVVLLALLTPSLEKAIDAAERVSCGANLHAHSHGTGQYGSDNRNRLLSTPRHFNHIAPYPMAPYVYKDTHPGDWSLEAMHPYVGGMDPAGLKGVNGVWKCPSNKVPWLDTEFNTAMRTARGPTTSHDGAFIHSQYSYYGGVNRWGVYANISLTTAPERLAGDRIGSPGILMGDTLYSHHQGTWVYNHGQYEPLGGPYIQGINQLYGDGGVRWTFFTETRNAAMSLSSRKYPEMGDYVSNDGTPATDLNYY